ncbi:hypothetical protein [Ruminococcus sp. Marseille-P6503]|uniref:hypothetical protein n=1 Tax=Ruminococcus sp. Marseille-P6503 TaxID=2364796 RepID=UPI000F53EA0F|nr:hypothetical protein [Ruminococcus sp. Marseille-P6503]
MTGFSFTGVCFRKAAAAMIAVCVAAVASGCGKGDEKPPELKKNFTCTAVIVQNEEQYRAQLERIDGVGWRAVFSEPETIEGMEVSLLNDQCTVNFKELTYTADREELPENGMIQLVASAADRCISGKGIKSSSKGGNYIFDGKTGNAGFTAEVSDGTVSTLEIAGEITAEFSDYDTD